jgi:spermidine synthase
VIPWVELDRAHLAAGDLRLMRRGTEYAIKLGVNELMTSRLCGSEEALATLACAKIRARPRARVLIGGLGMGFTLRAALAAMGRDAKIIVAELVPAVIDWARGPLAEIFAGCLDDPRVELIETDVAAPIRAAAPPYDAILLDVDNGPEGMTQTANDRLYSQRGLATARAALRPGGVLAVWSSGPDRAFTQRLEASGYDVEQVRVRAGGVHGGARHVIWLATLPLSAGNAASR